MTTATKTCHGWACESLFPVRDNVRLRVLTMRRFSGQITTSANIERLERADMPNAWTFAPFSDFKRTLAESDERATKGAIERQHRAALAQIPSLINQLENAQ